MNLSSIFSVLDVETTGLDPEKDQVVQVGLVQLEYDFSERAPNTGPNIIFSEEWFINPGIPIPPAASAIHHITDRDVQAAMSLRLVLPVIRDLVTGTHLVAHHAAFDSRFLEMPISPVDTSLDRRWICTKRLAQHLWPEAPGFGNQTLRYWLGLIDIPGVTMAHRAQDDARVTTHILWKLLKECDRRELRTPSMIASLASSPIRIRTMPFGKHKDIELEKLPIDYIQWMMRTGVELDPDLRWSIEQAKKVRFPTTASSGQ